MKENIHIKHASKHTFFALAGALILVLGLLFAFAVQPAQAGPLGQDPYPVDTPTSTVAVPTATTDPAVTVTVAPTATNTVAATLAPPAVTGTPTMLVPVTGADLTQPGDPASAGIWVALWLLGMLLILYGLRAKLVKR